MGNVTVTEQHNDLGDEVAWDESAPGEYRGQLTNAFPSGRVSYFSSILPDGAFVYVVSPDSGKIIVNEFDAVFGGNRTSGHDCYIKIEVYPE